MYLILSDEEIHRVIEQANQYGDPANRMKYVALLTVLANYGPRISEALRLEWTQIDFAHKTITFPTLKRRKPMTRTLPLLQGVADVLAQYRATVNGEPRVFPMTKNGRTIVWRMFQKLLVRAGIARIKLHSLRHACGTRLARIDLAVARDTLGHSSIGTTDKYIHAIRMQEQFAVLQAIV